MKRINKFCLKTNPSTKLPKKISAVGTLTYNVIRIWINQFNIQVWREIFIFKMPMYLIDCPLLKRINNTNKIKL